MEELNNNLADIQSTQVIPESVTLQQTEYSKKFRICFDKYVDARCGLDQKAKHNIEKSSARKVAILLKTIGQAEYEELEGNMKGQRYIGGCKIKKINGGHPDDYKDFTRPLPTDAKDEVWEALLSQKDRLFFWAINGEMPEFHILAICDHPETKKTKRGR